MSTSPYIALQCPLLMDTYSCLPNPLFSLDYHDPTMRFDACIAKYKAPSHRNEEEFCFQHYCNLCFPNEPKNKELLIKRVMYSCLQCDLNLCETCVSLRKHIHSRNLAHKIKHFDEHILLRIENEKQMRILNSTIRRKHSL